MSSIHSHLTTPHMVCSLICSINHFPLFLLLFLWIFPNFFQFICPFEALERYTKNSALCVQNPGVWIGLVGEVSSWIFHNKNEKKKNPGNQTFKIHLDSFTRQVIFLPLFPFGYPTEMPHVQQMLPLRLSSHGIVPYMEWNVAKTSGNGMRLVLHLKNITTHPLSSHPSVPLAWSLCSL